MPATSEVVVSFHFHLECELCGEPMKWTNEIGSQPNEDGSERFEIFVVPHECKLEEIVELHRIGGPTSGGEVEIKELRKMLMTRAAMVGWGAHEKIEVDGEEVRFHA